MVSEAVPVLYRAPEFSSYHPAYSSAADLWVVGCILAESLATKPIIQTLQVEEHCNPYNKHGRRKNFKGFPPSSLTLLKTLLADNPVARQSASAALANKVMFPQFCYSKLPTIINIPS
ncbi:probable serine/threonine-protein kinase At1g54610 [Papaver somniferum]|uniref:probable serine/threonine-protein kinase At1g54610 n=1 Tax=Papaver somniferum TaxID=3469 RepID=UPI000E6FEE64|nr:probable serine/threonine-protein kinase At1g54610 [Papaver somniferum]